MQTKTELTPTIEQSFLTRNAIGSLVLALVLICDSIYTLIEILFPDGTWLKAIVGALGFILVIAMIVRLFKDLNYYKKVNRQTLWFSKFTDEYICHVSMKAYQYSFNVMATLLLLAYLSNYLPMLVNSISIHEFVKVTLAILLLSYGLPILYMLRKE